MRNRDGGGTRHPCGARSASLALMSWSRKKRSAPTLPSNTRESSHETLAGVRVCSDVGITRLVGHGHDHSHPPFTPFTPLKQYFGSITVLNVLIRDVRRKYMSDCLKNQILTYIFSYLEYVPPKSSM